MTARVYWHIIIITISVICTHEMIWCVKVVLCWMYCSAFMVRWLHMKVIILIVIWFIPIQIRPVLSIRIRFGPVRYWIRPVVVWLRSVWLRVDDNWVLKLVSIGLVIVVVWECTDDFYQITCYRTFVCFNVMKVDLLMMSYYRSLWYLTKSSSIWRCPYGVCTVHATFHTSLARVISDFSPFLSISICNQCILTSVFLYLCIKIEC